MGGFSAESQNQYNPIFELQQQTQFVVDGIGTNPVVINRLRGHSEDVALEFEGLPEGMTATFSQNPAEIGDIIVEFSADSTVEHGTYLATLTGETEHQLVQVEWKIIVTDEVETIYLPILNR